MFSLRIVLLALLALYGNNANSQDVTRHVVIPLNEMPSEQWVERVAGDPGKAGAPFVIRIHNDPGYIVLPHVHPIDENITVVKGSWWLGMGQRFSRSGLEPLELGAFGIVPKNMAHFAFSKTETIIQVHGIGPFGSTLVDPVYELTDSGAFLLTSLLQPGRSTSSSPPDCFTLRIGAQVRGDDGEGTVVGARCSPANQLTQYWVRQPNGRRFWATREQLNPL